MSVLIISGGRQPRERFTFHAYQRPRGGADVDRVENQQPPSTGHIAEQFHPEGAGIDEAGPGGDARILFEQVQGLDAETVVGQDQVAHSQDDRQTGRLPLPAHGVPTIASGDVSASQGASPSNSLTGMNL